MIDTVKDRIKVIKIIEDNLLDSGKVDAVELTCAANYMQVMSTLEILDSQGVDIDDVYGMSTKVVDYILQIIDESSVDEKAKTPLVTAISGLVNFTIMELLISEYNDAKESSKLSEDVLELLYSRGLITELELAIMVEENDITLNKILELFGPEVSNKVLSIASERLLNKSSNKSSKTNYKNTDNKSLSGKEQDKVEILKELLNM